jgi:D-serine deaminase-like pyridoxal phosphate-dependent protein
LTDRIVRSTRCSQQIASQESWLPARLVSGGDVDTAGLGRAEVVAAIDARSDETRRRYQQLVGRSRLDVETPNLILDLGLVKHNVDAMAAWTAEHAAIRPHAKAHKSPQIARLQVAAGAVGVTCATVWEAAAMLAAGLDGVFLANQLVTPWKLDLLADLSRGREVMVALDSEDGADALSASAARAGVEMGALIEVDTGMGRGGVRSTTEARDLALHASRLPGVRVRGLAGWEGHVALERDRAVRGAAATVAVDLMSDCADVLRDAGVEVDIVSAGGTNTFDLTGCDPRVTEIEAGSYVLMDTSYALFSPRFTAALSVVGTVTGRHGRRAILDCGTKSHAVMLEPPRSRDGSAVAVEVHEEHALVDVTDGAMPSIGDRMELLVSYCSGTVALNDVYCVVDNDRVVDVWPIVGWPLLPRELSGSVP